MTSSVIQKSERKIPGLAYMVLKCFQFENRLAIGGYNSVANLEWYDFGLEKSQKLEKIVQKFHPT